MLFFPFMVDYRQYHFRKAAPGKQNNIDRVLLIEHLAKGQCVKWFVLFAGVCSSLGVRHSTLMVPLST